MGNTTKARPKAYLKEKSAAEDCFVGGCAIAIHDKCPGIPMSNKCAACRCKKNYMGVKDWFLKWGDSNESPLKWKKFTLTIDIKCKKW